MQKTLKIGLFGFGVVGEGLYKALHQTPSLRAEIKKVAIKHPEKSRNAPQELFTTKAEELLYDPEINVIVEVINETENAWNIVRTALENGKAVVSASKKMIAQYLPELLKLQKSSQLPFLYEAAVCASIPVIRNLEEYYDNDFLTSVCGIVNGSTNYILSRIFEDGISFDEALQLAQEAGFAESDPTMDIEGHDAVDKLQLILTHAYGCIAAKENILFSGIKAIKNRDAQYAREKGYQLKLVAQAQKIGNKKLAAFVLPQFVPQGHLLSNVKDEYNGVLIESGFSEEQFFYGKGAGSLPTASAVLSDISALSYQYKYAYKKLQPESLSLSLSKDFYLNVYISFEDYGQIPINAFSSIDEWHREAGYNYLTGTIHFERLLEGNWWQQKGCSLILLPKAIAQETTTYSNQKATAKFPEQEVEI